jgi:RNA polymerase sigma-70 factor (ECF subfamily)
MTAPNRDFKDGLVAALPAVRRFAIRLSASMTEAEDLVQMTCERALGRWQQFTPGTRLESWLFSIMHSIWKNQLRRNAKGREVLLEVAAGARNTDGVRIAEGKIYLAQVLSALERLPENQSAAVFLVHLEGTSYREAAEILGIPQGTLESRLARARIALGRALDEFASSSPQGDEDEQNLGRTP